MQGSALPCFLAEMETVRLNAHAKINLSLRITGKRPDGYHEIVSFMQGTGLYDVIEIKKCSQNGTKYNLPHCTINCVDVYLCTDTKTIPTDMSNLALKAVKAFSEVLPEGHSMPKAVIVTIDKRLPVAAGIAGGSGNAAACLLGLNELSDRPFALRDLMQIGTAIGADVPFSVFMNAYRNRSILEGLDGIEEAADAAMTSGIGDKIEAADSVARQVILANPGTAVSTKAAYEAMDAIGFSGKSADTDRLFVNDMEKYTLACDSKAAELHSFMRSRLGADEVLMSGSGPTIVAYYKDDKKAEAGMEILSGLIEEDSSVRAWLTDTGR